MKDNTILEQKLVSEIKGDFYIDSYQRGYRWDEEEIEALLEDIYENGEKNREQHKSDKYCLQPIVVKKKNEIYELIDGQQRLTTLFLIYKYLHERIPEEVDEPQFCIKYNNAKESNSIILNNIDYSKKFENIDWFFIINAYETISNWFSKENSKSKTRFLDYLNDYVKIIWYEVNENENSNELFRRLNIGKIPLTSSELVRAMFLSKTDNNYLNNEKQNEIALQWDYIEKELNKKQFWYFITNNLEIDYPTKIDLILELITEKTENNRNKYYTFDKLRKEKNMEKNWKKIFQTFLDLKDWYEEHELYHKIGYLIASKSLKLKDIYEISKNKTKIEFKKALNEQIRQSIIDCDCSQDNYENNPENVKKILLLFNIETVRKHGEESEWFPFDKLKMDCKKEIIWTLEHIHAQHSKKIERDSWNEWLELHLKCLKETYKNEEQDKELIEEIEKSKDNPNLDSIKFESIQEKVIEKLSQKTKYSKNSIANLALLNFKNNAALNNSTFGVKRNRIIEMDRDGKYIPFCTRMVFLKYYTNSEDNQVHFWSQKDMENYVKKINETLKEYLSKEITLVEEE